MTGTRFNGELEKELLGESPKMSDYVLGGAKTEKSNPERSLERQ